MSLRLILIHFIYRVVFGVGIAALMWVGGHLAYAKAHQLYAMAKFKNDPGLATGMADGPLSSHPQRRSRHLMPRLESPEEDVSDMVLETAEENPPGIATGYIAVPLSGRLAGIQRNIPIRSADGKLADAVHRNALVFELQNVRVGDTIRLSTPEGIFRYFVTTVEIVDPSESGALDSHGHSELTIITTRSFPLVSAVPQRFIVHARPESEMKN